ncbi:hypothetical protein O7627_17340 [Solwaraspora sp. WMMD1047]|uniref:hypothetical protein n=1 Tax=Solwaraspora sp. WMMD1047 TaxID=3016102 RepID=UPI002415D3F6|nr:hypothetical protein [Solwaraspora sp. WMMD1047]MDG4831060.1 hypothetical protein [Solwaraspora sp. WMMD1047]
MTDHWDDWPGDDAEYDDRDTADLSGPADPADPGYGDYPVEDFADLGPADDAGPDDDAGSDGPFGYGGFADGPDEPFADQPAAAFPGPADGSEPPDGAESADAAAAGSTEAPVGADPDLAPYADADTWPQPGFPDPLDIGPLPEPVDGFPWTDPATLGEAGYAEPPAAPAGAPPPADLAEYASEELPPDVDPWQALAASDDPATSTLARFWDPRRQP